MTRIVFQVFQGFSAVLESSQTAYQEYKSPLFVQLELTAACNHKCVHCYNYWREPGEVIGTIKQADIPVIVRNLIESEVRELTITGGEPLLFPSRVLEAIDLAQSGRIKCSVNSNLALMTEEWAQAFKQRHVSVLTSFPSSDPATFDRIVGKQGAFQKVMRGLEIALASGVSVSANMVVMQDNKGHVYETGRFLHAHGIKNFSATKVHPAQQCRDFAPMQLRPGDVVSVLDDLLKLTGDLGMETDTLTCYPICLLVDADKYGSFLLKRSCSAGKTAGTIGADGGVRPCSHSDDIYGNAIAESLLDVWPRLREWRDGTFVPDRCKACKWMAYCGAGCRMDSKYFHGRRDQPDPYMIPENEESITMPQSESAIDLDDDQMLFVNPELLYREESFGTIVTTSSGTHAITKDSGDLLLELSDEPFTLREIVGRYGLDAAEAKSFFGKLLKKEVVYECELAEA